MEAPEQKIDHRQRLIDHLVDQYTNYSDQVPPEIVHSDSPQPNQKVRKAWFTSTLGFIRTGIIKGVIKDTTLIKAVNEFGDKYSDTDFTNRLTTPEDIQAGNDLILKVLDNLGVNIEKFQVLDLYTV